MTVRAVAVASLLCVLADAPVGAQEPHPLTLDTANGTEEEHAALEQVRRLRATFDLEPFTFTRHVRIDAGAIPHSHPVLTLNTRYLDDDVGQLATYLHEQFHWWVLERQAELRAATAEFEERFPEVPVGDGRGARDERSTYLHLVVCDLELQGLTRLVGRDRARRVLAAHTHYTWIYEQVLDNPVVREVNERHGWILP